MQLQKTDRSDLFRAVTSAVRSLRRLPEEAGQYHGITRRTSVISFISAHPAHDVILPCTAAAAAAAAAVSDVDNAIF